MILAAIGDTGYKVMLLLHLLAVVIGFAPAWLWPALVRLTENDSPEAAENLEVSIVRFSLPGIAVAGLVGFGLAGMSDKVYKMAQPWLAIAFVLWVVLLGIYFFVARPAIRAFRDGDKTKKGLLGMATGISHLILVVMLFLMIFKPGA
ncbi:MAG: hypothetical protein R2735_10675 [Microthrixaceae bacterium]